MKVLIATRNLHKLQEIRQILAVPSLDQVSLEAFPALADVVEDGDTFRANATKKAVAMAFGSTLWTLADDSGLEVDALGGEPGVRSARYAGEPVDYAANNRKLLTALAGVGNRRARFRCAIVLSNPEGRTQVVEGKCEGRIIEECRGAQGFGYDPLFVPEGYDVTFAQMDSDLKNRISHRAIALRLAAETWVETFMGRPEALARWS